MDALDRIPWDELTHAYGPASDVPGLLRELRTASPDLEGEDSPLWHLFGNIWHQGTVYEATPHAVPFLIELAADRGTPDRIGILTLLAEIARSGRPPHPRDAPRDEPGPRRPRGRESSWARRSHEAVAAGFARFVEMTDEPGEIRHAAAYALAQLPEHGAAVAAILRKLLREEGRIPHRAGLLLLIGSAGDTSPETLAALGDAANGPEAAERHAAAFSINRLGVRPLPPGAREAIMQAIVADDLEGVLDELPWFDADSIQVHRLCASLDPEHRDQVAADLIALLESGNLDAGGVHTLADLLFPPPRGGRPPEVTAGGLTPLQSRAVRAIHGAMKAGRRVFSSDPADWGLPGTKRGWRELAGGGDPSPVDEGLPPLADAADPRRPIAPGELNVGQVIINRHFGRGTVIAIDASGPYTALTIDFDEEGVKQLSLPTGGSA